MSVFRGMGPANAVLPEATGQVIGFMRNPSMMPFLRYTQLIPAPVAGFGLFRYAILDPDDPTRLPDLNEPAWAWDDPAPTGKGFEVRLRWDSAQTTRYAFPYQIGDRTQAAWSSQGINAQQLYDRTRMAQAMLHRASRVVGALASASWGANNTATAASLLGQATAFFDQSSGTEMMPDGTPNPNFQVIKKVFQKVKRRLHLGTNGALTGAEFVAVLPVDVAIAMATAGEIVNAVKQTDNRSRELTDPNIEDWSLPQSYGGFRLVVEDTPRCFIRYNADGTVADVTVKAQKDYILSADTIYFASRPGGLDGGYGFANASTVQCYTYNGEAVVKARGDSWNELTEGRIETEDKILVPSAITGFALTDVLST